MFSRHQLKGSIAFIERGTVIGFGFRRWEGIVAAESGIHTSGVQHGPHFFLKKVIYYNTVTYTGVYQTKTPTSLLIQRDLIIHNTTGVREGRRFRNPGEVHDPTFGKRLLGRLRLFGHRAY